MKFEDPVDPTWAIRVCDAYPTYEKLAFAGMGRTGWADTAPYPQQLMQTEMEEVRALCVFDVQSKVEICARTPDPEKYVGPCFGDIGSPLLVLESGRNAGCVYGLTSWVYKFCNGDTAFTRLTAYTEWISHNAENNQ